MSKRIGVCALTGAMLALVLTACGSSASSGDSSTTSASQVPTTSADVTSTESGDVVSTTNSEPDESEASPRDLLPEAILDAGKVIFAVDQHPPYEMIEDGEFFGPISDLQREITSILGVEMEETPISGGLAAILTGLLSERYDAFAGPSEPTPQRLEEFDGVSWLFSKTAYLYLDSKFEGEDPLQMCGLVVGHISGTILTEDMDALSDICEKEGKGRMTGLPQENTNALALAVKSGRAGAAIMTLDSANSVVREDSSLDRLIQTKEFGGRAIEIGFILPKQPGIAPAIQAALDILIENGKYLGILKEWGLEDSALESSHIYSEN